MPARGQGRHDSIEDAAVAMLLVVHELAQKCRTPAMDPPEIKVRGWWWCMSWHTKVSYTCAMDSQIKWLKNDAHNFHPMAS